MRATIDCTFFNGHKVQHIIKPGVRAVFSGKVSVFNHKLQLTHPQFEPLGPGDDVRRIDWNVTARMGSPFVKQFVEERELTLLIADLRSHRFAEGEFAGYAGTAIDVHERKAVLETPERARP